MGTTPQSQLTAAQAAVYAPDGHVYMVPNSDLQDALKNHGELAVPMKAPTGDNVWVPSSHVAEAQKNGGKVDWSTVPEAQHEGFWGAMGNTLKGMTMPQGVSPYPGMDQEAKTRNAEKAQAMDQQRKAEGRSMAYRVAAPVAGVVADVPGMENAAREGDTKGVLGHAAGSAAPVVAGAVLGELAPKIGPKIESALAEKSKSLYQSALKPSTRLSPSKVASAVQTGIDSGVPVTESGVAKLSELIADTNDKIKATIAADPTRPINKFKVADRLYDTADTFKNQVNPTADLQSITDAGKDFIKTQPSDIPAEQAQALKQGTYRQLSGKAYGEMKSASIESQKALARGLKEELANAFPELKELNAQDSAFYGLQPLLEKAVQRISNHQLMGIGTPAAMAATDALTGSKAATGVAGVIKAVVDNPSVKSRLAILLGKASKGKITPAIANARLAAYSGALAQAASSANSEVPADRSGESAIQ